jgi:hypothetical protein
MTAIQTNADQDTPATLLGKTGATVIMEGLTLGYAANTKRTHEASNRRTRYTAYTGAAMVAAGTQVAVAAAWIY